MYMYVMFSSNRRKNTRIKESLIILKVYLIDFYLMIKIFKS